MTDDFIRAAAEAAELATADTEDGRPTMVTCYKASVDLTPYLRRFAELVAAHVQTLPGRILSEADSQAAIAKLRGLGPLTD